MLTASAKAMYGEQLVPQVLLKVAYRTCNLFVLVCCEWEDRLPKTLSSASSFVSPDACTQENTYQEADREPWPSRYTMRGPIPT